MGSMGSLFFPLLVAPFLDVSSTYTLVCLQFVIVVFPDHTYFFSKAKVKVLNFQNSKLSKL